MIESSSHQSTVLEFACLWTLNKRQKLKNWHDGTLRFHQFNKRALVYDDHRRLVDDIFLPHTTISSGDELEFERILVTVEDALGIVTQDLTPIYQRKNSRTSANQRASPPVGDIAKSSRRCSRGSLTTNTQTRLALSSLHPPLSIRVDAPSSNMCNSRSAEGPRSTRIRICDPPQISGEVQIQASRQFVPPSRVRDVTDTNVGMTSPPSLTGINFTSGAFDIPTPLSSPVRLEQNSNVVVPPHRLIRIKCTNESSNVDPVVQLDSRDLDAWTSQESQDLFGEWRPPEVIARSTLVNRI